MKVLMLGWELPPHHTGGMGVVCYQLCKQMAKSDVDIEFILPFTADFPDINFMKINPALPLGVEQVIHEEAGSTYDSQYFTYVSKDGSKRGVRMDEHQLQYTNYVAKLVAYNDYDIIHAHDWLTFRAALAAKQVCNKPLIVHVHATEFDRAGGKPGNPLVHEIEYLGLHLADKIIAVSEATRQTIIQQYSIDPSKVSVVHNAIEFEQDQLYEVGNSYPYIEKMKADGYKVLLSAGRLTIQKGLTNMLYAMKEVVARYPKTLLLISGGGEQYRELIELSAELGIGKNVIVIGYLNGTGKAWRDCFRVADLFLMPSISEPFGLTPFEALTFGTPVLMSKQSGASEVLRNCLKVDFWDIDEMANMMCSVVGGEGLAKTLYNNGSEELSRLSWEPSVKKLLDIYERPVGAIA